jgi:hypothetical protein
VAITTGHFDSPGRPGILLCTEGSGPAQRRQL